MQTFIPGQRWISDAELHMGLGTVLSVDHRTVTIHFHATGEMRTYAKQTAPLTRVAFVAGDKVKSHEGWHLTVAAVDEEAGLLTYIGGDENGEPAQLEEGQLDNFIQLNRPTERLFSGQVDKDKWFDLRYQTLQRINLLAHSDLYGLTGARTSLIPHQLYIAHEVANRYAPRVLLADEVGLGKTIEAGLILHHQLLTERARRILIVVPETLVHQWLVEMLRRFNLHFSIFDEDRCLAIDESSAQNNPFHSEQLILCSLEFLVQHPERFEQASQGEWDLLVVDEAHHLQWSQEHVSTEYKIVEQLASSTKGVLLLTATPEQLGRESHFARLRLLDAARFPDFNQFIAEENAYAPIAAAVERLLSDQPLDEQTLSILKSTLKEGDNQQLLDDIENHQAREELVEHLLDRHGTGRVLFRNTRAAVKGFPQRQLNAYPLPLPESYAVCINDYQSTGISDAQLLLSPELLYKSIHTDQQLSWIKLDPRVNWLSEKLIQLHPEKVLVIAASADTAIELAHEFKTRQGIHAAVFHEGLSIVERDRSAAFFADQETGCQVLICSEIGSEGRNFQFAHHMVLFDLPLNPDLLEQRIGRLDRIGQKHTIQLHVPYLENSAQEIIYRWYKDGLSAFEHTCPAGHNVFVQVQDELIDALHQIDEGIEDIDNLVEISSKIHGDLNQAMQQGRDRLLEYNSCRPRIANALKEQALREDEYSDIYHYMDAIFDCFNIDFEEHSQHCYIIHPSDHMINSFPGLPEDGATITFNRNTALKYEDVQYLSWEHPMVSSAMEMVHSSELGNTAVTAVEYNKLSPGTMLLECLFILESASSDHHQSSRYLPPTIIRVLLDETGKDHSNDLDRDFIFQSQTIVDIETAKKIVRAKETELRQLVKTCEDHAYRKAPDILRQAHLQTHQTLEKEINRLRALQKVNPNVRKEEINFFEHQLKILTQLLDSANLRLDAVRVIIST